MKGPGKLVAGFAAALALGVAWIACPRTSARRTDPAAPARPASAREFAVPADGAALPAMEGKVERQDWGDAAAGARTALEPAVAAKPPSLRATGRAIDSAGAGVPDLPLVATLDPRGKAWRAHGLPRTRTGSDGRFAFDLPLAWFSGWRSSVRVGVEELGRAQDIDCKLRRPLDGGERELGDLLLREQDQFVCAGTVRGQDGELLPLGAGEFELQPTDGALVRWRAFWPQPGCFELFTSDALRKFRLAPAIRDYATSAPRTVARGARNLEFTLLRCASIAGSVWLPPDTEDDTVFARCTDRNTSANPAGEHALRRELDGSARFVFDQLRPGVYRVSLHSRHLAQPLDEATDIVLAAGAEAALPAFDLRGRLRAFRVLCVDPEGRAASGWLRVRAPDAPTVAFTRECRLAALGESPCVEIYAPGFRSAQACLREAWTPIELVRGPRFDLRLPAMGDGRGVDSRWSVVLEPLRLDDALAAEIAGSQRLRPIGFGPDFHFELPCPGRYALVFESMPPGLVERPPSRTEFEVGSAGARWGFP